MKNGDNNDNNEQLLRTYYLMKKANPPTLPQAPRTSTHYAAETWPRESGVARPGETQERLM